METIAWEYGRLYHRCMRWLNLFLPDYEKRSWNFNFDHSIRLLYINIIDSQYKHYSFLKEFVVQPTLAILEIIFSTHVYPKLILYMNYIMLMRLFLKRKKNIIYTVTSL